MCVCVCVCVRAFSMTAVGLVQRVSVTLTVENLTFADRGNYTCVSSLFVISQQHSVQAYASLQVLGKFLPGVGKSFHFQVGSVSRYSLLLLFVSLWVSLCTAC